MVRLTSSNNEDSLRDQIFNLLNNNNIRPDMAINILLQCQSHIRNRMMLKIIAKECGLKLSRFLSNDELELYYDIKKGRHDIGYISKGWEEPGFRIGEIINVPKKKIEVLKVNLYKISKYCAVNGITMTIEEKKDIIEIQMDGVIYNEGFNKETFMKTLESLNECVDKAESLLYEQ